MLKLTRLKIERFRNVRPGTELFFHDERNILLGLNGSGKTTLLKLISAALLSDFSQFAQEAFEVEFDWRFDEGKLDACITNEPSAPLLESDAIGTEIGEEKDKSRSRLSMRLWCEIGRSTWKIEQRDLRWTVDSGDGRGPQPWETNLSEFQTNLFSSIFRQLADKPPAYVESVHFPARFDEGLERYERMIKWAFVVRRTAAGGLDVSARLPVPLNTAVTKRRESELDPLVIADTELPFLRTAITEMGFSSAAMRLELTKRSSDQLWLGHPRFRFFRRDASFIHDDQLSYGQKRLLSYLYYLDWNRNSVVADELVNGLHHRWIDLAIKSIGDRQAFLTSQNPLLFDYLQFSSPEDVERQFIQCSVEQEDGRDVMVWRNLALDDATRFFKAYEVGVQHVGEILITKGLW